MRKEITSKRPYRCTSCGWRGWGEESGPRFSDAEIEIAESVLASEPPDLKASNLARSERRRQEDVDLGALDVLGPINNKRE